jgi:hypothetical protein
MANPRPVPPFPNAEKIITEIDTNGNGHISRAESDAFQQKMTENPRAEIQKGSGHSVKNHAGERLIFGKSVLPVSGLKKGKLGEVSEMSFQ